MTSPSDGYKGGAAPTYFRYREGDSSWRDLQENIFQAGWSHKCPTYVHRAPPCQGSCPSGHDIRGWLSITRGLDKPTDKNQPWQDYAFRRMTEANPFPAVMGRVCPAPCESGCNRNELEEQVGINAVEHYVGDWTLEQGLSFPRQAHESGKKVAIIGGGPGGLAAAYFLRRMGHGCTIFESYSSLGGMMRFGIPGYRTPKDVLDGEIKRIVDLGVEVRLNTRVGVDISVAELEKTHDAVFWAIGAQAGKPVEIPGGEASNCIDGISFLRAFNEGRLQYLSGRVLVIGAGDTAMDVAAVARRIGNIHSIHPDDRPENVVLGHTAHDVATAARRQGAEVWIVYRRPISQAPATKHELDSVIAEGVHIRESLVPVEVVRGADGRARALRVCPVDWVEGKMKRRDGEEFEIECDLIVGATGQAADFKGFEDLDNGRGLMSADQSYALKGRKGHFVGGDVLKPHLLTTAIGHARIAAEGIDRYLSGQEMSRRPKVDVHHFNLLEELRAHHQEPEPYDHAETWGTDHAGFAVHNYEDRSFNEIIQHDKLFLGHFGHVPRHKRAEVKIGTDNVLGNFDERFNVLKEKDAIDEAERCMSCGMCFECDNCVIYCPQVAISSVKKKEHAIGRYVTTDYKKCIGCHICRDVCPTGYIQMGLGE
ncbi:MAG: 4Fe-4S dicluster domain-containing protein [Alphaproteobacteria bacterium]|nr:4Fe-4S dicluster domain-containing protein [Alphaproteobacteria bacterium]